MVVPYGTMVSVEVLKPRGIETKQHNKCNTVTNDKIIFAHLKQKQQSSSSRQNDRQDVVAWIVSLL